ncbi:MAG: response regulator [Holophagaceae bacterium]|jgi:response regulator RpfG family c-di-GMP phosphodiesterase|nr:response regulator [Holophagaceae bacterium]
MKPRVLLVDDDVLLLRSLGRILRDEFEVVTAESGEAALQVLFDAAPFAVVIADMMMPGMDGIHFLDQWKFLSPNTTRVMLTGQAELGTAIDAVNQGQVFRFLTKPIKGDDLRLVLVDAVNQYELVMAERTLLEQTLTGSVQTLVELLSLFDPKGFGRTKEMRDLAVAIAEKFSLDVGWDIGLAALLARIGWLAIPVEVQAKITRGERLSIQENEMFLRAPEVGSNIIANIPRLQSVAQIIKYSTKNYDGTGYPNERIQREDLPLGSRILKVVSEYVNRLQIRKSKMVVFSEIETGAGTKYDPDVLKALGEIIHVPVSEAERHVLLALDELQPGMVLADDVYVTNNEIAVLPMGTQLNLLHIEKLRNYSLGTTLAGPIMINKIV